MASLLGLLKKVKHRAGVYIGNANIFYLYFFIAGYKVALHEHDVSVDCDFDVRFNVDFQNWIYEKFENKLSKTWAQIISFHSVDESEAWEIFWNCLDRFLVEKFGKNLDALID